MALDQDALNSLHIDRDPPPPAGKPLYLRIVVVICVLLLLGEIGWRVFSGSNAVEVFVTQAVATRSGANSAVLDASGYVVARRQATVASKVTGKVIDVLVEEGVRVKQDQLLARLDDTSV